MRKASLTKRDIETLDELRAAVDNHLDLDITHWIKPLDCGGSNGSHHSQTLTKLAKYGFVERKKYGAPSECGSCLYTITLVGRHILKLDRAQRKAGAANVGHHGK